MASGCAISAHSRVAAYVCAHIMSRAVRFLFVRACSIRCVVACLAQVAPFLGNCRRLALSLTCVAGGLGQRVRSLRWFMIGILLPRVLAPQA